MMPGRATRTGSRLLLMSELAAVAYCQERTGLIAVVASYCENSSNYYCQSGCANLRGSQTLIPCPLKRHTVKVRTNDKRRP
ncbi:hypothetical protein V1507DRAFT_457075 [Lipomyces tetrasporus]